LASIPSTNVPTKKQVHREENTHLLNPVKFKKQRDAASFDISLGLRLGVADWATLGLPFAQCGKYRPGHPVSMRSIAVGSKVLSILQYRQFLLILFDPFCSNSAVPSLS